MSKKYKYTEEQKEVMVKEAFDYYKRLKDPGLFNNGVPSSAHTHEWAMMAMLKGNIPNNAADRRALDFLNGRRWEDI